MTCRVCVISKSFLLKYSGGLFVIYVLQLNTQATEENLIASGRWKDMFIPSLFNGTWLFSFVPYIHHYHSICFYSA